MKMRRSRRKRWRENNKIVEEGIITLTRQNIKIVVEGIKKIEGEYYNCGGGKSRMRSESIKIVEEGINKFEEGNVVKKIACFL